MLMGQQPEQMIALGMVGIEGENLAVDGLRFWRLSGPMVLQAPPEQQRKIVRPISADEWARIAALLRGHLAGYFLYPRKELKN